MWKCKAIINQVKIKVNMYKMYLGYNYCKLHKSLV